jgi:hypothetical protein
MVRPPSTYVDDPNQVFKSCRIEVPLGTRNIYTSKNCQKRGMGDYFTRVFAQGLSHLISPKATRTGNSAYRETRVIGLCRYLACRSRRQDTAKIK